MDLSTNGKPGRRTPAVREAAKAEQLARLDAKARMGACEVTAAGETKASAYSELYASHPSQQRVKAEQQAERKARRAIIDAAEQLAASEAVAGANIFAGAPTIAAEEVA